MKVVDVDLGRQIHPKSRTLIVLRLLRDDEIVHVTMLPRKSAKLNS